MIQHLLRGVLIPEGYIPKLHRSTHICKRLRAFFVRNIRLDIHDFPKSGVAGITILKLFGKVNEFLYRLRKVCNI